jgi:DNA mismatch endonuclease (patch repair protein)
MPDVFTKAKRSEVMSLIRSRGNKATEVALVKLFRSHKITGWRRHVQIGGRARSPLRAGWRSGRGGAHGVTRPTFRVRPDFVFRQARLALFVDGCFWHGCPTHGTKPKGNAAFWRRKFASNLARDRLVSRTLRSAKWRVLRIWEHDLARKHEARLLRRIQRALS